MPSRRLFLGTSAVLSICGLAGCARLTDSDPSTARERAREYPRLEQTTTYVAEAVGLRLPEGTTYADDPERADLIVLHGNPSVSAGRVVTWLTQGRVVAFLGEQAQRSWLDIVGSEPYREAFGSGGYGIAEPAPELLVGVAVGDRTTTYRHSWRDQPTNDELLGALDETLADIRSRRTDATG